MVFVEQAARAITAFSIGMLRVWLGEVFISLASALMILAELGICKNSALTRKG
jgi:hypothetical protein